MTKHELQIKGKSFGITLPTSMLKGDMETAVNKAEKSAKKATPSKKKAKGEY